MRKQAIVLSSSAISGNQFHCFYWNDLDYLTWPISCLLSVSPPLPFDSTTVSPKVENALVTLRPITLTSEKERGHGFKGYDSGHGIFFRLRFPSINKYVVRDSKEGRYLCKCTTTGNCFRRLFALKRGMRKTKDNGNNDDGGEDTDGAG